MGWIAIDRKIKNHWIWKDPIKFQWWIDLLLSVNYEDKIVTIGSKKICCRRGECVQSLKGWAEQWGVSRDTARNFLSLLEKNEMITHENLGSTTRISVVNYDFYQNSNNNSMQTVDNQDLRRKSHTFYTDSTHLKHCDSNNCDDDLHTFYTDFTQTPTQHNNRNNKNNLNNKEREGEKGFSPGTLDLKNIVLKDENKKDEELHVRQTKSRQAAKKRPNDDISSVVDLYRKRCPSLKPVSYLTDKRKNAVQKFIEKKGRDFIGLMNVFDYLERTPEYNGENAKGWKADFDWIFADGNIDRIANGQFTKRPKKPNES